MSLILLVASVSAISSASNNSSGAFSTAVSKTFKPIILSFSDCHLLKKLDTF